jgi:protein-S-isoprenylcysteine O-methyltransferase Ste14
MNLPHHLVWTAILATVWCVLHSALITHTVRDRTRALFPRYHIYDRILYVLFSTASLALLFVWLRTLPQQVLWEWDGAWKWLRGLGLAEAAILFWLGSRSFNGSAFLGLTQIRNHLTERPQAEPEFTQDGILGIIRHPWYTGTLIFLAFCLPVTDVNLIWRLIFAVYVLIGTELEERKLLRELGEPYAAYRRKVPRFFPALFRRPSR